MERKEQRVCIKFCVRNDKSESEIYEMLQRAYGAASLSRYIVYEWVRCFRKEREPAAESAESTPPVPMDRLRQLLAKDRRLTARELAPQLGLAVDACRALLAVQLGLRRVAAKLVPCLPSDELKARRLELCRELSHKAQAQPDFLDSIVSGDHIWLGCHPQRSGGLGSLLVVFFDSAGLVHHEFGEAEYREVLVRLREKLRARRPGAFRTGHWFLQHDETTPGRGCLAVRQFLAQNRITLLPQAQDSPDLAPPDYFLVPRLKVFLRANKFIEPAMLRQAVAAHLHAIPLADFRACFLKLFDRWTKCIAVGGEYFDSEANLL